MATFTYTDDIPDANHNPSTDQPDMKINTNSIDSIIAVDHFSFEEGGLNQDGYHKVIHQPVQGSDPAPIATINDVYSKNYTPDTTAGVVDTQLFSMTASGIISQLTGHLTTTGIISDGWQWVGGILLQWGFVSSLSSGTTKTVTFKDRIPGAIPFPNNCFFVGTTLLSAVGTTNLQLINSGITVEGNSVTKTKFNCVFNSTSGGTGRGFYWIAIGN